MLKLKRRGHARRPLRNRTTAPTATARREPLGWKKIANGAAIKMAIAQPFSTRMPKDRVCKRLMKANPEICEIKYAVKVPAAESGETKEETAAKIKKMRVKELKGILADRGVDCVGCMEKEDYVKRVMDTNDMAQEL